MNLAQIEALHELALHAEFELASRTGLDEAPDNATSRKGWVAQMEMTIAAADAARDFGIDEATINGIMAEARERLIARWADEPIMRKAADRARKLTR